jgi:hypothetical protein
MFFDPSIFVFFENYNLKMPDSNILGKKSIIYRWKIDLQVEIDKQRSSYFSLRTFSPTRGICSHKKAEAEAEESNPDLVMQIS